MGARPVVWRKAAATALTAGLTVVLSTAPASAQSTFTVADLSVPLGSGVVQQVITVSGTVVGTPGDLVITAVTGAGGLVAGLSVSPSTHGVCTQTYNNGYDVDWHCVPNSAWGSGTIAVLMDTGSSARGLPPATRDWIDAETTTITDANIGGGQATGTVSLLTPTTPPPPNPPTRPANPVTPNPGNTRTADGSVSPTHSSPAAAATPPSAAAATSISPSPTGLAGASRGPSVGGATTTAPSVSAKAFEPALSSARVSSSTIAASGIAAAVLTLGLALTALIRWRKRTADASPPEER